MKIGVFILSRQRADGIFPGLQLKDIQNRLKINCLGSRQPNVSSNMNFVESIQSYIQACPVYDLQSSKPGVFFKNTVIVFTKPFSGPSHYHVLTVNMSNY
ncbi:hypothetical protein MKW92_011665 [Papaver armeniacum]|nr:hypothetical protein MKW92_011665 [Papaver armeniacum]